jgi:hypothetical protein
MLSRILTRRDLMKFLLIMVVLMATVAGRVSAQNHLFIGEDGATISADHSPAPTRQYGFNQTIYLSEEMGPAKTITRDCLASTHKP